VSRLVAAFLLGAGVAGLAWAAARQLFAAPVFARRNVRGVDVPVGAGLLAVLAVVAVQAVFGLFDVGSTRLGADGLGRVLVAVTALGFGLLGTIDDLVGDHGDKGFRGHLRALVAGRLTTGGLKLVGGGLLALGVVAPVAGDVWGLVVGAAVVALAANTANLFDRAPGRVTKVALVAFAALVALTPGDERLALVGVSALVGGVIGLFRHDLAEELMLGDAGANPLGAVLGLGVVLTTATVTQLVVLVVLVVANVAGERVSFSAVIARTPALQALDDLGRRPR
jgi:UDP-GlcNAc:undecaprenyl-phosphate GlcNAc-1-phosphate transferase